MRLESKKYLYDMRRAADLLTEFSKTVEFGWVSTGRQC